MAVPTCSKGFIKETKSYPKSYSNKNSRDGMTTSSFSNNTKANLDTMHQNDNPNSLSENWRSSKSSEVSKVYREDFPTLSSSFTSSYKSSKSNSDIPPKNQKSLSISYSDKLQSNSKGSTNSYFNKNIIADNYSKNKDTNTEEIYKRNKVQSNSLSHRQAFNENTHITSNLSNNNEVDRLSQSRNDKKGNVIKNNSAEHSRTLNVQKCDTNESVSHKSCAELGNEHCKNKSPSNALSTEPISHVTKQNVESKSSWWKNCSNLENKSTLLESQEQHSVKTFNKHSDYDCSLNGGKTSDFEQQHKTNWLNKEQRKHKENNPYKDNSTKMTNVKNSEDVHNNSSVKKNGASKPFNSKCSSVKTKQELEVPKKHKKRLSKVKRQTAFQTGKLLVLSPEFHSRIVQNLTNSESNVSNNEVVDIDNLNEYPSLAQPVSVAKVSKQTFPQQHLNQRPCPGTNVESQASPLEPRTDEIDDCHWSHVEKNGKMPAENQEPPSAIFPEDETIKKNEGQNEKFWNELCLKVKQCPREPIQLFDLLAVSKPKEKSKKKIEAAPTSEQNPRMEKPVKVKGIPHALNVLDSSAPVKRGKEREHPKQKKFTPLKKVILSERLKKKELLISSMESSAPKDSNTNIETTECLNLNDGIQDIQSSTYEIVEDKPYVNCLETPDVTSLENGEQQVSELADHCLKLELIVDTAEAFVDNVIELAVAKVRTMGLNVNATCFESPSLSKNKTEFAVSDGSFQFSENPPHSQSSVLLPCQSQVHSLISSEVDHQNRYPNNGTELTGIDSQTATETCSVTNKGEESERNLESKWSENELNLAVQATIHIKIFREYCTHLLSKELNEAVLLLIDTLAGFQDRQHQKDPVKARMKRRLIYGIKEVKKYLKLKKLKCVIMAPDLEDIKAEGGLNTELAGIIKITKEFHIPCVFAAERKHLGKVCHKSVPVSCLGIFSYEGSEAYYRKIIDLYEISIQDYRALVKIVNSHITDENIKEILDAKKGRQDVLVTQVRSRILKSILSKENENPELPTKYDSNALQWFSTNYHLKFA